MGGSEFRIDLFDFDERMEDLILRSSWVSSCLGRLLTFMFLRGLFDILRSLRAEVGRMRLRYRCFSIETMRLSR